MSIDIVSSTIQRKIEAEMQTSVALAEQFVNRNYLINLSSRELVPANEHAKSFLFDCLFEITRIVYDPEEGINDKLVSIYSALYNMGSSLILIVNCTPKTTKLYIGTRDTRSPEISGNLLQKSLRGNFPGVGLVAQTRNQMESFMEKAIPSSYARKNITAVSVVPSEREDKKENYIQGMEKFIETMSGENYTAIFIAEPISKQTLVDRKNGFEELASSVSQFESATLNFAQSDSIAMATGISESLSKTIGDSITKTNSTNDSFSTGIVRGKSKGSNFSVPFISVGSNQARFKSKAESKSSSSGMSDSVGASNSESTGTGKSYQETTTSNQTNSVTMTIKSRRIQSLLDKINAQLGRIQACESFGLWEGAAYFISDSKETSLIAANTYKALVSGENTGVEDAFINIWDNSPDNKCLTVGALQYIRYGMHPVFRLSANLGSEEQLVTPASAISGLELPVFMGLPLKSINGITSLPMAEFGRNVVELGQVEGRRKIRIGSVTHMGEINEDTKIQLKANVLSSHTLITGSSGVGKSNTVYRILQELGALSSMDTGVSSVRFLVIEPAKGEYKQFFSKMPDVNILTVGQAPYDTLRINPFEFPEKITVLEHLDRLIEIFSACWPLYAAMPAILKSSFEKAYQNKGWDLKNSIYLNGGAKKYPTFFDVLNQLPKIINSSEYSNQSKGDYTGALVTRVASLTTGTIGEVFCDTYAVPNSILFDENTIVDVSRVGSVETVSLIMGILILKLNEYRFSSSTTANAPLSHVTVLEEAHNILKRINAQQGQDSGNVQGKSIEMICNSIAELRTYGEGFIIADQTPSALARSAISNTSTKIIMRLADYDDCMAVGKSIGLSDSQIAEIGKLGRGVAVVYQGNWLEPVLVQIDKASEKYEGTAKFGNSNRQAQIILTSELIEELIQEKQIGEFIEKWLVSIIQRSGVSKLDKLRYTAIIKDYVSYSNADQNKLFPNQIVKILGCEDMICAFSPSFSKCFIRFAPLSNADKKQTKLWYQKIYNALNHYVNISSPKIKQFIAAQILFYAYEYSPNEEIQAASQFMLSLIFK